MKKIPFLLYIAVVSYSAAAQTAAADKESAFAIAAKAVADNFYKKNISKLNTLIDSKNGVYIVFRPGAMDAYKHTTSLDSEDKILFSSIDIPKPNLAKTILRYSKLPVFDCDEFKWSKTGLIADSSKRYKPVTTIAEFRIKYDEATISKKELNKIKAVEARCRKVIFAPNRSQGIIFYLSWSGTKWYLAIVDTATMDCGA